MQYLSIESSSFMNGTDWTHNFTLMDAMISTSIAMSELVAPHLKKEIDFFEKRGRVDILARMCLPQARLYCGGKTTSWSLQIR